MHSMVKNVKIICVWSIKPCEEEDKLYASHKLGHNEAVKQYNSSDITRTLYLGTAHNKNSNTGILRKLLEM